MAGLAIPLLGMAAGAMSEALSAIAGGTALAAVFSLSGDQAKEKDGANAQAMPRTRERTCKCPPEQGAMIQANHSMSPASREYQARITGFPYDTESNRWSMEWKFGREFDGFQPAQCLLQEAKANYDQFIDEKGKIKPFFTGFDTMAEQAREQAKVVRAHPPAKLMWYFQTPKAWAHMIDALNDAGVPSAHQP